MMEFILLQKIVRVKNFRHDLHLVKTPIVKARKYIEQQIAFTLKRAKREGYAGTSGG
jgi:hypothetical protein